MKKIPMGFKGGMVLLLGFITAIGLICSSLEAAEGGAEENTLRLALRYSDIRSLNPHIATTTPDRVIVDMVFNALVRYKPGDASFEKMEPDLAEDIPKPKIIAGQRQEWVFKLKKNIMFHPFKGSGANELTSEDVLYSFKKASDPKRSAYAGEYTGMNFEIVDKYTIKITLENALSPSLFLPKIANYSGGFIVSKKAVEQLGDSEFKTHPVGTGPFMLKEYRPTEEVVLSRNDHYFRRKPQLDGVKVKLMPDNNSREMGLLKGELDVIEGVREQPWVDKIRKFPNTKLSIVGPGETVVIHFNLTKKPFDNIDVRKAVAYALDRRAFDVYFGKDLSEPIYSFIPDRYLPGGLTREEISKADLLYEYNLNKAKELLSKAGYASGFSAEVFSSESPTYRGPYELIQDQVRKIGIDLKLSVVDHSSFHSMIRKDLSPMVIYGCWRPNADVFLTRFFHPDTVVVSGSKPDTNFSHYVKIGNLIDRARTEPELSKQIELWKEAQMELLKDMVAYSLVVVKFPYAARPNVDWGHEPQSSLALYPQITENTRKLKK
jgi:peptide/nickel transport system substrate-binding protein